MGGSSSRSVIGMKEYNKWKLADVQVQCTRLRHNCCPHSLF